MSTDGFAKCLGLAKPALNGKLWARTGDNRLWVRDPVEANINWQVVGHANDVKAMTAVP